MSTITDFHKLAKPISDVRADGTDLWYVRILGPDPYYLLNHTCHLGDLADHDDTEIYFSTEIKAHMQAMNFYNIHNELYPFMEEWRACLRQPHGLGADPDIESQVMEF